MFKLYLYQQCTYRIRAFVFLGTGSGHLPFSLSYFTDIPFRIDLISGMYMDNRTVLMHKILLAHENLCFGNFHNLVNDDLYQKIAQELIF